MYEARVQVFMQAKVTLHPFESIAQGWSKIHMEGIGTERNVEWALEAQFEIFPIDCRP